MNECLLCVSATNSFTVNHDNFKSLISSCNLYRLIPDNESFSTSVDCWANLEPFRILVVKYYFIKEVWFASPVFARDSYMESVKNANFKNVLTYDTDWLFDWVEELYCLIVHHEFYIDQL